MTQSKAVQALFKVSFSDTFNKSSHFQEARTIRGASLIQRHKLKTHRLSSLPLAKISSEHDILSHSVFTVFILSLSY